MMDIYFLKTEVLDMLLFSPFIFTYEVNKRAGPEELVV